MMWKRWMWWISCVFCLSLVSVACTEPAPNNETVSEPTGNDHNGNEKTGSDAGPKETITEPTPDKPVYKPAYTFKGELVACQKNESFEKLKIILEGGKNNPTGRGEQGSAYDPCNGRMIVFGGNDYQPKQCANFGPKRFKGDTWMYVHKYKNWIKLKTDNAPSARGRQAMTFDRSRKKIYLFGGRYRPEASSGAYILYNDFWEFDVNTDKWKKIETTGAVPTPRSNSYMIYDYVNDSVILFGGNSSTSGLNFKPLNDTYRLNLKTMKWWRFDASVRPKARLFHSLMLDSKRNRVILYGGGGVNAFTGPFFNDVWAFDLKKEAWSQIWSPGFGKVGPAARIETTMIEDIPRNRMLMFAGHDDTSVGHRNDVWSFDLDKHTWKQVHAGDTGTGQGCTSFCRCSPDFVQVDKNSPERREYHAFEHMLGTDTVLLFGGKTDCGYIDDTWSYDLKANKWTKINDASQGEACKRTGRANCKELCY